MRWRAYSPGNRLMLARTGRINRLSGGLCDSDDFDAVNDRMATLMAAGFMSICKSDADASHSAPAGPVRCGRATPSGPQPWGAICSPGPSASWPAGKFVSVRRVRGAAVSRTANRLR